MTTKNEPIEAAAKVLAECMDYPWANMPEQGRQSMREHAAKVIAALLTDERITKHTLRASECLSDSQVMLVSSLRRILAAPAQAAAVPDTVALLVDAGRWREIERRFNATKTSQAERILSDLSLADDYDATEDTLGSLVDAAIAREA